MVVVPPRRLHVNGAACLHREPLERVRQQRQRKTADSVSGKCEGDLGMWPANESRQFTLSVPVCAGAPKTLRAFVDSGCQLLEKDEANNQATRTYTAY